MLLWLFNHVCFFVVRLIVNTIFFKTAKSSFEFVRQLYFSDGGIPKARYHAIERILFWSLRN